MLKKKTFYLVDDEVSLCPIIIKRTSKFSVFSILKIMVIYIISIVIPTFNRENELKNVINSLLHQNYTNFEILIVDNGPSTDKTKEIVENYAREDKRFRYISTSSKGCIFARNIGAKSAKGEIILTLDDDIELLEPNTLKKLIDTFKKNDNIGIVGSIEIRKPDQIVPEGPNPLPVETGRISLNGKINRVFSLIEGHGITEVDHVRSAFMAIRGDLIELAGGFDEIYNARGLGFRYETDYCLKIKDLGYKVVVNPEIKIWHKGAKRSRGFGRGKGPYYFYYVNRNHIFFLRRFFWKKNSFRRLLIDILEGSSKFLGIKQGLIKMKKEFHFMWPIKIILSIIGKISGYLRYFKYGT